MSPATSGALWARRVILVVLAFEGLGALWGRPLLAAAPVLLRRPHSRLWVLAALGGFLIWFVVEFWLVGYGHVAQIIWSVPVLVGGVAAARLSEPPSR